MIETPVGQVVSTVGRAGTIAERPATSIGSVLLDSPGVTVRPGSGGRDAVVSIRGNNARSTAVLRNMVVLEDGFVLTQPDGASRFDLVDPRAYSRIDVFRGPQSALFGNYATGGALAFRTRTGREIDGTEIGTDVGGFGYLSHYFTVGGASGPVEISLFASDVRAGGFLPNSAYDTQTVNLLASYTPSPDTRLTLKVINNTLQAEVPARASLDQFRINPYQRGCAAAATAAPGCTLTNFFRNGALRHRAGDRHGGGFRTERPPHRRGGPPGARLRRGDELAGAGGFRRAQLRPALLHDGLSGLDTILDLPHGPDPALRPDGPAGRGLCGAQRRDARHPRHHVQSRARPGGPRRPDRRDAGYAIQSRRPGAHRGRPLGTLDRNPRPQRDGHPHHGQQSRLHGLGGRSGGQPHRGSARFPKSRAGNRAPLPPQRRLDRARPVTRRRRAIRCSSPPRACRATTPGSGRRRISASTSGRTGSWPEACASASPPSRSSSATNSCRNPRGGGRLNYFVNAPASEHRGVELGGDWAFAPGWRGVLTDTFDDQIYTRFTEQLQAGAFSASLDRAGRAIPGVPAHQLLARVGYDQIGGALDGFGGFVEAVAQDGVFIDNGNQLRTPGYAILNANLHYATALGGGTAKRLSLYVEVRNLFDTTFVASAQNLASSLNRVTGQPNGAAILSATTGSILPGAPRNVVGGMKLSF